MKKKKPISRWQDLEAFIQEHCKKQMSHYGIYIHRFYDTKAAGGILPAQPSDFLVLPHTGVVTFLEAKFSEVHESLREIFSSAVSGQQMASARLVHRARGEYQVLFYSALSEMAELWDGWYLAERRSQGARLDIRRRVATDYDLERLLDTHVLRLAKYQS